MKHQINEFIIKNRSQLVLLSSFREAAVMIARGLKIVPTEANLFQIIQVMHPPACGCPTSKD